MGTGLVVAGKGLGPTFGSLTAVLGGALVTVCEVLGATVGLLGVVLVAVKEVLRWQAF